MFCPHDLCQADLPRFQYLPNATVVGSKPKLLTFNKASNPPVNPLPVAEPRTPSGILTTTGGGLAVSDRQLAVLMRSMVRS